MTSISTFEIPSSQVVIGSREKDLVADCLINSFYFTFSKGYIAALWILIMHLIIMEFSYISLHVNFNICKTLNNILH